MALAHSTKLARLNELELQICGKMPCECQSTWLDEYLDLGLEFASNKPEPWQEGWLERLFRTLHQACTNPSASRLWQQQCADYLYLPFFALSQLYRGQACKNCKLCELLRQYQQSER